MVLTLFRPRHLLHLKTVVKLIYSLRNPNNIKRVLEKSIKKGACTLIMALNQENWFIIQKN